MVALPLRAANCHHGPYRARNGVNGETFSSRYADISGLILSWMSALAICDN